jgi:hypothetical protein
MSRDENSTIKKKIENEQELFKEYNNLLEKIYTRSKVNTENNLGNK